MDTERACAIGAHITQSAMISPDADGSLTREEVLAAYYKHDQDGRYEKQWKDEERDRRLHDEQSEKQKQNQKQWCTIM